MKNIVLSVLLTLIAVGVIGGAYYLGKKSSVAPLLIPASIPPVTSMNTSSTQKPQVNSSPLFTGKIKKITSDLGLFKITDFDKENGVPESIIYYEAGVFTRGEFKGLTRILAIRPPEGPGSSIQFLLATSDFKTYLLDDPINKANYPEGDWDNPYTYLDRNRISKTVSLDSEHAKTITLEKPFGLIRRDDILTENKPNGQKDKNGNDIHLEKPITDFDTSLSLTSIGSSLPFYAKATDWGDGNGYSDKDKKILALRNTYLHQTTLVHISDSTGLTYSYIFSTINDIDTYLSKMSSSEKELISYKKQVALYNQKKLTEYPTYSNTIAFPGMNIKKSVASLPNDYYSNYESAFPGACGGNTDTFIIDSIKQGDLTQVTSSSPYQLYVLKDSKHPIYEIAYDSKMSIEEEMFKQANPGMSKPTFDTYVAKHPLLFFKDTWGRWGAMGEFDIKLMGGCGKPVVYLYPEKPINIHVSFASPISLNTNIPTYHDGWFVNASPDGALTDLQPQYTNCDAIDTTFGSEYAVKACKATTYPYLYWSGRSSEKSYPMVNSGWIIERKYLGVFLQEKLTEMGLTQRESSDMMEYWIPEMSKKNVPYYRISFLQTKDMNEFIPMNVNPKPDSVLRVFLDYKALSVKPSKDIEPQKLTKFERKGFTLVEWGGLK